VLAGIGAYNGTKVLRLGDDRRHDRVQCLRGAGWGASMSGDVHVMLGRALLSIGSARSILSVLWVVLPLLGRRSTPPAAAQVVIPRFMVEPQTAMSAEGRLTIAAWLEELAEVQARQWKRWCGMPTD
jgi:hypothetical protein